MRTIEQVQADLHVVIRASILDHHPKSEIEAMIEKLRAEREAFRSPYGFRYVREDVREHYRPIEEIVRGMLGREASV